jgi:aspartate aminotransferase
LTYYLGIDDDGAAVAQRQRRRDLIVRLLNAVLGIQCLVPAGAFYVYPSVSGLIGLSCPGEQRLESDRDIAFCLLEEAQVTTVHGAGFGLSPPLRLSYAVSEDAIEDACRRIAAAVARLEIRRSE